jgi:Family of unknown function (DUF6529)
VEDLVEDLTRGNVTEVKVALASIVAALALYQVALMAVGYGKLRLPFLGGGPASRAHRAIGDALVVIIVVVALMCIAYFGVEEVEDTRGLLHVIAAIALLSAVALKIVVVRWWHGMGRFLPYIGGSLLLLVAVTWITSAGDFFASR